MTKNEPSEEVVGTFKLIDRHDVIARSVLAVWDEASRHGYHRGLNFGRFIRRLDIGMVLIAGMMLGSLLTGALFTFY